MSAVGQIERKTQQRVVKLFQSALGYDYLGDWSDRPDQNINRNRNIDDALARQFLKQQGYDDALITNAAVGSASWRAERSYTWRRPPNGFLH